MTRHVLPPPEGPERVVLAAVAAETARGDGLAPQDESRLEELRALALSAGAEVVGQVFQRRASPDSATFLGRGKVEDLKREIALSGAEIVVFDNDLTPAQGKNLEDALGVRVLDRSELILDIFAERARTREAKLQVELAQLQYFLPRLKRMWTHLSRIRGGIGLRGPGETQLEVDRRVIRDRIATLQSKLSRIERRRELQRRGRGEAWNVALVGYTNAGKSTIMNRLANERLPVENRLFATLDATTRRVVLPEGEELLLTDTVGFIRDLPHHLVASFRATLEEVVHADLLLHVVDVSDSHHDRQLRVVELVLAELGVAGTSAIRVFNKLDKVAPGERAAVRAHVLAEHPGAVVASAVESRGLVSLVEALTGFVRQGTRRVVALLPFEETRALARLYDVAEVLDRRYTESGIEVELRARPEVVERLRHEGVALRAAS